MPKFRKKSAEVLARRFETNNDDGTHIRGLVSWANSQQPGTKASHDDTTVYVHGPTVDERGRPAVYRVDVGDWLVFDADGFLHVCAAAVFEKTYEQVST
jgi:hypothetical protein